MHDFLFVYTNQGIIQIWSENGTLKCCYSLHFEFGFIRLISLKVMALSRHIMSCSALLPTVHTSRGLITCPAHTASLILYYTHTTQTFKFASLGEWERLHLFGWEERAVVREIASGGESQGECLSMHDLVENRSAYVWALMHIYKCHGVAQKPVNVDVWMRSPQTSAFYPQFPLMLIIKQPVVVSPGTFLSFHFLTLFELFVIVPFSIYFFSCKPDIFH